MGRKAGSKNTRNKRNNSFNLNSNKKLSSDKKTATAQDDYWYRWSFEPEEFNEVVVYTKNDLSKYKNKYKKSYEPTILYSYRNGDVAYGYRVRMGDVEQKEIFDILNLTDEHEKKIKVRKKRTTKKYD